MSWNESSSGEAMKMRLAELTGAGINPKSIPEIRQIAGLLYHPSIMSVFATPLLETVDQAERMALCALAALGDADAVVELGHFGMLTTAEALERLKAFRKGQRLPL